MAEVTKPISIRLKSAEIKQLQARAFELSATATGVARELIRTGLAGGDNKALADRLMRIERRVAALEQLAQDTNTTAQTTDQAARDLLAMFEALLKALTGRTRGVSLPQLIEKLAPYLIGWRGYFGFCQTPRVLTNLEAWIRRRLRSYLWRQWRNGRNRFKELRGRGVPKFNAAVAAGSPTGYWRMSGHPAVQQALRNHAFHSLGLPRLYVSAEA
jgi:hypothetical protein